MIGSLADWTTAGIALLAFAVAGYAARQTRRPTAPSRRRWNQRGAVRGARGRHHVLAPPQRPQGKAYRHQLPVFRGSHHRDEDDGRHRDPAIKVWSAPTLAPASGTGDRRTGVGSSTLHRKSGCSSATDWAAAWYRHPDGTLRRVPGGRQLRPGWDPESTVATAARWTSSAGGLPGEGDRGQAVGVAPYRLRSLPKKLTAGGSAEVAPRTASREQASVAEAMTVGRTPRRTARTDRLRSRRNQLTAVPTASTTSSPAPYGKEVLSIPFVVVCLTLAIRS
ncbi:hypothetical protein HBB16_04510, partial [Pseudonocardia sp. MCCB 268]|nr:hypothetical protein [Pseudonocardia cytotoxica]